MLGKKQKKVNILLRINFIVLLDPNCASNATVNNAQELVLVDNLIDITLMIRTFNIKQSKLNFLQKKF